MQKALKKAKEEPLLSFFDKFTSVALIIFGKPSRRIARGIPTLRDEILKSNMYITPEGMVSVALFVATLCLAGAAIGTLWGLTHGMPILALLALLTPVVFLVALNGPKISQSSRAGALDNELPFVIGFMVVLAGGGVSPLGTLRRITQLNLFPSAVKEAKRILVDIEVFGMDPISALERAARYNPNKFFSEFLYGYTSVLRTGGDSTSYLNTKLTEVFENRSTRIKKSSDTIASLAEGYVAVTALLGITLFTLFQVQALISHTSGGMENLFMFAFVVVPLLSLMFIWILDGAGPKQPYVDYRPYKIMLVSIPIGLAAYFLPAPLLGFLHIAISLKGYLQLSLALIAMMIMPAIFAIRYSREKRGLEKMLPEFTQDMAESRKIGLPPERSIEMLSEKNYGRLSKHVRKMGVQLSWGVALRKVISTFTSGIHSWLTRAVGTLIVEVVDIGGGTISSFTEMSNFTRKINSMEAERRSALKPYLFVIYMAAMMVVVTTFLMTFFMTQSAATGFSSVPGSSPEQTAATIDQLLVAAIFETWVIGFVAGKMGEGSTSDGFKHSLMLVVISLVSVYAASYFVSLPV